MTDDKHEPTPIKPLRRPTNMASQPRKNFRVPMDTLTIAKQLLVIHNSIKPKPAEEK